MIEKPFLLDPSFADLIDSGAFRQRVYDKFSGMKTHDLFVLSFAMNIPVIITAILGALIDRQFFLGTAIFGGVVGVVILISVVEHFVARDKRRRMHRLAFEGELVTGHIIACERKCYRGASYKVEVQYAATAPSGKEVKWTQAMERDDLLNAPLPPPGWPVLVLMVDETLFFML